MRQKYRNDITDYMNKYFKHRKAQYNYKYYICYNDIDIEEGELYIMCGNTIIATVWLTFRDKIFFISFKNPKGDLKIDNFEKRINNKFDDKVYDFERDRLWRLP